MLNTNTGIDKDNSYANRFRDILKDNQTIIILLGMVILMSILSPSFLKMRNLINILRQISMIAIIGMGVTFCIITTGIDLSSGSVVALAGVVSASFALGEYPLIFAIFMGILAGVVVGLFNGVITAYGGIPAFIPTLGMLLAARGIALVYSDGRPITGLTDSFRFLGGGYFLGIPVPIYIMFLVGLISHILLKHTKFGKHVYAIGGNQQAAIVSGINVKKTLTWVYVYAGALSGIAGIILAGRLAAGQPTAGESFELDAIAAAVIGGTSFLGGIGTIPGTITGALVMGVLNNGLVLLSVSPYATKIIKGLIIVGAVLLDMLGRKRNN